MNQSQSRSGFLTTLGANKTWSVPAFIAASIVSIIIFGFGNLAAISINPLLTLGLNTAITTLIFIVTWVITKALLNKAQVRTIGLLVLTCVILLSALRGYSLQVLFNAISYSDQYSYLMRIVLSLTTFLFGFLLTILAVQFIIQWRADEAKIRQLTDQRDLVLADIERELADKFSEISTLVKLKLEPRLLEIPNLPKESATNNLKELINSVVRPLSHALAEQAGSVIELKSKSESVTFKDFVSQSLNHQPLAPLLTGIVFSLLLLPRNLVEDPGIAGLTFNLALGIFVVSEIWLVNQISRYLLRNLSAFAHLSIIGLLLLLFGLVIGAAAQVLTDSTLGFNSIYVVAAVVNITLALLLGGIVNTRTYFKEQSVSMRQLEAELEQELTKARQYQWRQTRTLSNWLHGPLQATLNSAAIRISRATDTDELNTVQIEVGKEITNLLSESKFARRQPSDLATVIQRITDTWQDITKLNWQIEQTLPAMISNSPTETAISEVLTEAVFNAIKHCAPAHISISLATTPNKTLKLTVTHAGQITPSTDSGLGTRIYDNLTIRHSLIEADGVVTFEAEFPVIA